MKKRILSILLLCCMVLTLLPTTAFAADESPAVTNVTVTFDSNGGGEVKSQTIQQGQQVQRPADPVKEGYTFIGWYDKNDLDNKYYNMPEWNFSYPVTKDLELVAQWVKKMLHRSGRLFGCGRQGAGLQRIHRADEQYRRQHS